MSDAIKKQIMSQLDGLSDDEQRRILEVARRLASASPEGVAGKDLLRFAGMFDGDDARSMAEAIEEGCERVDLDEW